MMKESAVLQFVDLSVSSNVITTDVTDVSFNVILIITTDE